MSASGANRMTAPVAITARMTTLAISQKPERVLNILRSSTPMIVRIGMGAYVGRAARACCPTSVVVTGIVAVLMLLLLRERCCRAGCRR